jgi:hypothetical protein
VRPGWGVSVGTAYPIVLYPSSSSGEHVSVSILATVLLYLADLHLLPLTPRNPHRPERKVKKTLAKRQNDPKRQKYKAMVGSEALGLRRSRSAESRDRGGALSE